MGKERKKEELNIPVMILCIVGVVLVVFGFLLLKTENFKLNVISTEGTVTGVQIKKTADGVVESRSVNLSYTANNGSYNTLIPGSGNNEFYVVSTRANNSKNNKNNVTITYYNSVSDGTNNNIPYNETGYTAAKITQGQ